MSYNTQNFATRHGAMGDQSEAVHDEIHGDRVHRLGLNRYWANGGRLHLGNMTLPMRYAPDRMVDDALVECMGIGRDQTLKLKDEKLEALQAWTNIGPVRLFVYDSKNHRYWLAGLHRWLWMIEDFGVDAEFHDGKAYKGLHSDHFPGEPTDAPAKGAS